MDNIVKASDGSEVYINRIYESADSFYEGLSDVERADISRYWMGMMLHICDTVGSLPLDDAALVLRTWEVFRRIASRFGLVPTISAFAAMTGHNRATFCAWGESRRKDVTTGHADTYKKMFSDCHAALIESMANDSKTSVNKIFLGKSVFGMVETAPIAVPVEQSAHLTGGELPRLDLPHDTDSK